jgi:cytochrome c-type biogenesis protein CcmH
VKKLAVLLLAALVLVGCGSANQHVSAAEIDTELVCPVCHETLDESTAPIAMQMKQIVRERVAAGWTKKQILDYMVANFGQNVLSEPAKHGFDLLAWVLPIGGALIGVAALAAGALYWSRRGGGDDDDAGPPLDSAMDRRIDEELALFDG